jgi:3-phenylpropionate/trans-cinnamate dioxygenase ferredoxin subunit
VPVCALDDLADNENRAFDVDGVDVLVCRIGGEVYAIENRCTHQATPLEGGRMRRGCISCPLHGVLFNLQTGAPMGTLTRTPVRTFAVDIHDGMITIDVEQQSSASG